jgi:uncharacterized repeat protein (TIGR01451 family)
VSASLTESVTNRAVVAAANPDPHPSNNTVAVALTVAPGAALTTGAHAGSDLVVWTDAPERIVAGEPFTYTLTVANDGPLGATGITLHDILPPGLLVHSTTPGRPTCTLSENAFTCRLDDPESDRDITFTFVVLSDITTLPSIELDPLDPGWPVCEVEGANGLSRAVHCYLGDLASGQKTRVTLLATAGGLATRTITNTVSVRANESDADLQNNAHRRAITVGLEADLCVRSHASGAAIPGQPLTYTLRVTNAAPSDARDVVLTDTLPAGVTLVSVGHDAGGDCALDSFNVSCYLGTLSRGQGVTVTVLVAVNAAPDLSLGETLGNAVVVGAFAPDPDRGNNAAYELVSLGPGTDD